MITLVKSNKDSFYEFHLKYEEDYIKGWIDPNNGYWWTDFKFSNKNTLFGESLGEIKNSIGGCNKDSSPEEKALDIESMVKLIAPQFFLKLEQKCDHDYKEMNWSHVKCSKCGKVQAKSDWSNSQGHFS
ncbi:hypothetical protein M0P65_05560 [Candidatus Gracilibacteria bacterium]|nr:hypothetical protein [Candidatus Gracilibacteria bacterium]